TRVVGLWPHRCRSDYGPSSASFKVERAMVIIVVRTRNIVDLPPFSRPARGMPDPGIIFGAGFVARAGHIENHRMASLIELDILEIHQAVFAIVIMYKRRIVNLGQG